MQLHNYHFSTYVTKIRINELDIFRSFCQHSKSNTLEKMSYKYPDT